MKTAQKIKKINQKRNDNRMSLTVNKTGWRLS